MSGNTFGRIFTVTSFGESHGEALGIVIDGCPPGLTLYHQDIQKELERRRPGRHRFVSQRQENDQVKILSGVFDNRTTGTPIGLLIENMDARSSDYEELKDVFRPGHADYTYHKKYGIRDYRGGGRASARETVMRVAAGAIAKKYLAEKLGIKIQGFLDQVGEIQVKNFDWKEIDNNDLFFPDKEQLPALEQYITQIRRDGDSIGACIKVLAKQIPPGLGAPVFDKLDADIAHAMMSINAVKAVAIGDGFSVVTQKGSEHRDALTAQGFTSNHAGGILGGISTGQDILVSLAIKPTSSIHVPIQTMNEQGEEVTLQVKGRHDPCVGIRAVPIAEAMMALVLMDHWLRHKAQNIKCEQEVFYEAL